MKSLNFPTLEQLISSISASLGSYAPVIEEIKAVLSSPQCSLASVGMAIEKDPDLTARLLKLANSAFYGFGTRLSTVTEAVSLIGIQQVQDLILSSSIIDKFAGMPPESIDMASFWRHSLACGTCARILATERRLPNADKFFVAGLLHDVGRLVLYQQAPAASKLVFQRYQADRMPLQDAEQRMLGFDNSDIARALLQRWNYPDFLVQAVGAHHRMGHLSHLPVEAAVVHFSDYLVTAMQIGCSGDRLVPPLKSRTWEVLGMTNEKLETLMDAIDEQMQSVEEVFINN